MDEQIYLDLCPNSLVGHCCPALEAEDGLHGVEPGISMTVKEAQARRTAISCAADEAKAVLEQDEGPELTLCGELCQTQGSCTPGTSWGGIKLRDDRDELAAWC